MLNLDTKAWSSFRIKDLFEVSLADGDIKEKECELGNIPLVSSGETNNGIVTYTNGICAKPSTIIAGNKITVDMFGNAYFQPDDFYCVSHGRVNILTPRNPLTTNQFLFICSLIKLEKYRFSYGRALYSNGIKELTLKLPTVENGSPDWKGIDEYMQSVFPFIPSTQNSSKNHKINIKNWHNFQISSLFNLENGKVSQAGTLEIGNDLFYLGAKKDNNGLMGKCIRIDKMVSKGNCLVFICDGQGSVGYVNYMDQEFMGTVNLTLGYNPNLNPYTGLFIATVASLERPRYSYGRKWRGNVGSTRIKLPAIKKANGDYEPDWQFMENYIKSLPYGDCI
ncbi:putative uncharacterized protein [Sutterella sp. CAG:521]|nr:putative uncharacterized protein [Sutterella sp. CAG:521]